MTRFWVEPAGDARAVATAAIEAGADALVATPGSAVPTLARLPVLLRTPDAVTGEGVQATVVVVRSPVEQAAARAVVERGGTVVVETPDWRVIPLENLVAWSRAAGGEVVAVVADAATARLALGTLETGVHGILLRTADPTEVARCGRVLAERAAEPVSYTHLTLPTNREV